MAGGTLELDSHRFATSSAGAFSDPETARVWMGLHEGETAIEIESMDDPDPAVNVTMREGREEMDRDSGLKTRVVELLFEEGVRESLLGHVENDAAILPICDEDNRLLRIVLSADRPSRYTTKILQWPTKDGQRVEMIEVKGLVPGIFPDAQSANSWARSLETYKHGARSRVPLFLAEKCQPIAWISGFGVAERRELITTGSLPLDMTVEGDGIDRPAPGSIDRGKWATLTGTMEFLGDEWLTYGRECKYITWYITRAHLVCGRLDRP